MNAANPVLPERFQDTTTAFAYKSDTELRKAIFLFRSFQAPLLVRTGPKLVEFALKLGLPVDGLVKNLLFDQFCGGVTLDQALDTSQRLYNYGVQTTLDYAVEAQDNESGYEQVVEEVTRTLQAAHERQEAAFTALKVTGLGSPDMLAAIQAGEDDARTQYQYSRTHQRLLSLCETAHYLEQPVLIDAEETWTQDPIDVLAEEMMARFNTEKPIVYTTVQLYRHDRLDYLKNLHQRARQQGYKVGVKLVRGAYLEKENRRAAELGYPTPMQPNKAATDRDFDAASLYCLEHLEDFGLCAGTHSAASCNLIANWMEQNGVKRNHPHVWFSQLYGMSDNISFNLAQQGYNVAKYLPFGPLRAVLPYLFRRAEENSSIADQTGRELALIIQELQNRRAQLAPKQLAQKLAAE